MWTHRPSQPSVGLHEMSQAEARPQREFKPGRLAPQTHLLPSARKPSSLSQCSAQR
ncbi:protein of unknown function [Nitratireductor aquimarinus]